MSVEANVFGYLSGHAALTALVAMRIYPEAIAAGEPLPAVVYSKVEGEEINGLDGTRLIGRYRFSVTAWSPTRDDAEEILDACVGALAEQGIPTETRVASFDEEAGIHGASIEFDYWG